MAPDDPVAGRRGDQAAGPGSSLPSTLAERVEEIVRVAEREAATIQRDLEARRRSVESEAQRYLEAARREAEAMLDRRVEQIGELTGELMERAHATRHQFDALIAALERAQVQLDAAVPGERPPAPSPQPTPTPDPAFAPTPFPRPTSAPARPGPRPLDAPPRDGRPFQPPDPSFAASLEAARLVAIEMAVAGRTRAEVDAHLHEAFRVSDTTGLLDDVFGPSAGGEATRGSWVMP